MNYILEHSALFTGFDIMTVITGVIMIAVIVICAVKEHNLKKKLDSKKKENKIDGFLSDDRQ